MRIVHGVSNIAGLPALLARAQREEGHQATAVVYGTAHGSAPGTVDLTRLLTGNRITRKMRRARVLAWLAEDYDVFHIHFHTTLLRHHRDLALYKALRKRIIFHLHGCDIRDPRRVRVEHAISACATCPIQCLTDVKLGLPAAIDRYADAVIVATPDLLEFVPGAMYIPNPIDTAEWEALRTAVRGTRDQPRPWVVVHAPTDRAIKGTVHVEAAVQQLRSEGIPIELRLLEGLTAAELRRACVEADVAIDQVLIGWIGLFALEMMALGKPVMAYIRPDLQRFQPDLPVATANPRTLADELRALLNSKERQDQLSEQGIAWVQTHHNLAKINRQILDLYAAAGAH